MPPPRPRSIGCSAGALPRPNPNTPMSERQQMALLIQMTASTDNPRLQKSKEVKKEEECEASQSDKLDTKDKVEELSTDARKESRTADGDGCGSSDTSQANTFKRNFSDVDEEDCDELDDVKKRRRKEPESSKEKSSNAARVPNKLDKGSKQSNNVKSVQSSSKAANDKDDAQKTKSHDLELDDDDSKSDLCGGGLKVPPLKIVIPQQNCSLDTDGNCTRTGKLSASRSAALPYVVSSSNDSNDREIPAIHTSPRDSPVKSNQPCGSGEEKSLKQLNEDKNLRVLRSAHRVGITSNERNSNNSSPQIPSNSPSPASSTAHDLADGKATFTNSPPHQTANFEQDNILNLPSPSTSSTSSSKDVLGTNDLHPRKRKIKSKTEEIKSSAGNDVTLCADSHPHDLPFINCFQMYMNIRKQVERKWKNVFPVKPRPPQGFSEYSIYTKKYILHNSQNPKDVNIPSCVSPKMKDIFLAQRKERQELYHRHIVEKEKLCLNVEQEIIRIHSKAARCMACQSLPFSACTYIKDAEVYNILTHEQEDKDRNARYRFNGRLLLSWLQDVDDKWEKIKESMVLRHHNEAESLHAVQLMDWECALKKYELFDPNKGTTDCVPIVHVSDDFELLPA